MAKLEVNGGTRNTLLYGKSTDGGAFIMLKDNNAIGWYFGADAGRLAFLTTNDLERLTILSSGNVGIGTTSPGAKLHLESNAVSNQELLRLVNTYDAGGGTRIDFDQTSGATKGTIKSAYDGSNQWTLSFGTEDTAQALTIINNGNVGIGTASPEQRLHVSGGNVLVEQTDAQSSLELFREDATPTDGDTIGDLVFSGRRSDGGLRPYAYIRGVSEDVTSGSEDGRLDFLIANIPAGYRTVMTLNPEGNVGIGTTSPTGPLTVSSSKGKFVIVETELIPNGGSVALETLLPGSHGMLDIIEDSGWVAGTVYIRGGVNVVTEVADPLGLISTTDIGGTINVLADGDNTYTLRNRRGSTRHYTLMYRGF